jgi:homoserine O-acetyltransferase/O-succinyltransferase
MLRLLAFSVALTLGSAAQAADELAASAKEGDYIARNFVFRSGEKMAELKLHYTTLGTPSRDSQGRVTNAVLILHGTGGDGHQFYRPQFADVLFVRRGPLDPAKYYIILADGIGHGKSSKPSDGLRAKFPHYDYDDMVAAQYAMLRNGLNVDHLLLIVGTSMGCMHAFMWGEIYPDFVDAMMPLACLPVEIAGRNRVWRKLAIDAITSDPDWKGGEYAEQPKAALRTAASMLLVAGGAPILWQKTYPTREAADKYVEETVARTVAGLDANDLLYQVSASRDYNPGPKLEAIKARVTWINSADDFINPPELGIAEREAKRLQRGKFILLPASEETHGHGSHTWATLWQAHLAELLKANE